MYFINESSYENMVRFKELLKRMKKVKDEYEYVLEKKTYKNKVTRDFPWEEEVEITTGYELSRQKGADISTKKWVAGFEDSFYMRKSLGELNDRLEELYPQRAGKITRGKVTDEILDILV